ncbi:MAG: GGDEF domain-containing protein [Gemmatimonadales bacterium]
MTSDGEKAGATKVLLPAPLIRALDQSEQVKDKVEQCAVELSSVNAVLKEEITDGVPLDQVERALDMSEEVEVKVQQCAEDLATVNDALAEEIDERNNMERQLLKSAAALSQSKVQERKLRHLALHDATTSLPNLALFNDRLRNGLAQAKRHEWRLAVMFIDLDDFKGINDAHGHDVGDQVLQLVAQRLQTFVRGGDTVSRRGGDEFLFLMLEAKDENNAANLAAKIIDNVAQPCEVEGVKLTVRASIGIAVYPEDGRSVQELLKNADIAMYAAKQQKSGRALYGQVALAREPSQQW